LDLSFNLIEKIEGLHTLTKLTDLSLFCNKIQVLEGLDNNSELEILSIGENKLQSLELSVTYLKCLKNNLKVLRINGNKFEETSDKKYGPYCISYLTNLQYLDYKLIDKVERVQAEEENKDRLDEFAAQ
jgi:Leucine-rich repeat (LRR) protein